jgi:hypothetical protein
MSREPDVLPFGWFILFRARDEVQERQVLKLFGAAGSVRNCADSVNN